MDGPLGTSSSDGIFNGGEYGLPHFAQLELMLD